MARTYWQRTARTKAAATLVVALVASSVTVVGAVAGVTPASAYQLPTGVTGTTLTYPSGLTITGSAAGSTSKNMTASATQFGASTWGYQAGDYTPVPPVNSPGILPGINSTSTCNVYGLCPTDLGSFTFTFNRPVRNIRMHIAELGGASFTGATTNSTSARLTLTTPGVTPSVVSGRNLTVTGGKTIEALNKAMNTNCTTVQSSPPACGTVQFTGTTSSLTFSITSFMALVSGTSNPNLVGPDYFPVTFTADEDYGDAPSSYDQGDAASATVSDLQIGTGITADNTAAVHSTTDPNASANAGADTDDGFPNPLPSAVNGVPYSLTVPLSGLSSGATLCGWIDFNRNGVFDSGERACATPAAGATTAVLTWPASPAGFSPGATYARLRLGYNATQTQSPTGLSDSGEVEDYAITLVTPAPALTIVKTASPAAVAAPGQTVTYTFVVTNTGNVPLTAVAVNDTQVAPAGALASGPTCAATTLAVAASTTCTATYTVTQADVDAGRLRNTATATGTPPGTTPPPVSPPSTVTLMSEAEGTLTLVKSADPVDVNDNGVTDLGDRIEWRMLVTNTGKATVDDIMVSDPTAGAVTCPESALAPGESMTCTAPDHVVTAADVANGKVANVAVASGRNDSGPTRSQDARAVVRTGSTAPPAGPSGTASTGIEFAPALVFGGIGALLLGALLLVAAGRRRRS